MEINSLTQKIIGESIHIHKDLGPGLLESANQKCLFHRLISNGMSVEIEKPLPIFFDNTHLDCGYGLDLVVENTVLVEIKSIKRLKEIHLAQMITYLKLGKYPLGLLINFNEKKLMDL